MRQNLEDSRKDAGVRDSIRAIRGNIETIFWMLRNMNTSAATVLVGDDGGGGSNFNVETVLELPDIPSTPGTYKRVFWTSNGAGNGDNQMWEVYAGQTKYTACQYTTLLSGVPL